MNKYKLELLSISLYQIYGIIGDIIHYMSMEGTSRPESLIPRPQVEGPNPRPSTSRFDIATENYADGWPNTPVITESAERARIVVLERSVGEKPGSMVTTKVENDSAHITIRMNDGSLGRYSVPLEPLNPEVTTE